MALLDCKRTRRQHASRERGQALLELLPVISILLILGFGAIDLSRAIWQLQVISSLTREGSNLASRNTSPQLTLTAVVNDGAVLNLATNGEVIVTSVDNEGTSGHAKFFVTGQWVTGGLGLGSKVGKYTGHGQGTDKATLPTETPDVPVPGGTVFITEVYSSYSPITPLGAFVKLVFPSTLYDIAYF
jgi:Flp pilus assembly protein TadG